MKCGAPSPLAGEGWGEGYYWIDCYSPLNGFLLRALSYLRVLLASLTFPAREPTKR